MKNIAALAAIIVVAYADMQSLYGQCGGTTWTGATACPTTAYCSTQNAYYAQCVPAPATTTPASISGGQTLYGQCGGTTYTGPSICPTSAYCSTSNAYYAQCIPVTTTITTTTSSSPTKSTSSSSSSSIKITSTSSSSSVKSTSTSSSSSSKSSSSSISSITSAPAGSTQTLYGQCGGTTYTGPTICPTSAYCSTQGVYYAQCVPGTAGSISTTTTTTTSTTTPPVTSSTSKLSSSVTTSKSSSTSPVTPPSGLVQYAGVNIAGCDFGCDTNGNCGGSYCPTGNGPTQMSHFVKQDGLNIFRLPVGWQYLVNNNLGGTLDANYFATYDSIVQSCLSLGARCIIDVHNYARWNGGVIGQGGPTNAQFTSLWSQLAAKYATSSNVIFGIMNEPHDLDMPTWAGTVQAVVNAIRAAGATSQLILLPGTSYTSVTAFVSQSAPSLSTVVDADGTTSKLIYDVHQYLDSDGSGTHADCVTDHISDAFSPLATYLRQNGRKAMLTETGGGSTQSCYTDVCAALQYLNSNNDVYLGWVGWAAGNFDTSYVLSETPNGSTDQPIVVNCIAGAF